MACPSSTPTPCSTRARAWIADDPDDADPGRARAAGRRRRGRRRGGAGRPGGPVRRHPRVRHGGAARRGRRRPEPDEPGRGQPRRGRPRGLPQGHRAPPARSWSGSTPGTAATDFARDTAEVMTGAGITVWVLPRPLPTPMLAFAIRELGCAAGVMVTASHNPPQDNGYKVYLGDGSQIVPPADAEIAARIAAVGSGRWTCPVAARARTARRGRRRPLPRHRRRARRGRPARPVDRLHAAARRRRHVRRARCSRPRASSAPRVVEQQEQPDPDFPTVAFPNPEEPGAMDLAMALAEQHGADIVVANDPDADRCAAAVPGPHGWRMLRGDEVGALLAHHLPGSRPHRHLRDHDRLLDPARARWPARPGSRTSRRSPASSGSAGSTGWPSATRRRSATASTPTT